MSKSVQGGHDKNIIIFSDSQSVLQALSSTKTQVHALITEIKRFLLALDSRDIHLVSRWVPGHMQITGNESADAAARNVQALHITLISIPRMDLKDLAHKHTLTQWNLLWKQQTQNQLYTIKPHTYPWPPSDNLSRCENVLLTQLRIGHTRLTHGYPLNCSEPPECDICHTTHSALHIYSCPKYPRILDTWSNSQDGTTLLFIRYSFYLVLHSFHSVNFSHLLFLSGLTSLL